MTVTHPSSDLGGLAIGSGRGGCCLNVSPMGPEDARTLATSSRPSFRAISTAAFPMSRPLILAYRLIRSPPFSSVLKSAHRPLSRFTEKLLPLPPDKLPHLYSRPFSTPPGNQDKTRSCARDKSASANAAKFIGGNASRESEFPTLCTFFVRFAV